MNRKERVLDLFFEIAGLFIMSIGIHSFIVPANIAPGLSLIHI